MGLIGVAGAAKVLAGVSVSRPPDDRDWRDIPRVRSYQELVRNVELRVAHGYHQNGYGYGLGVRIPREMRKRWLLSGQLRNIRERIDAALLADVRAMRHQRFQFEDVCIVPIGELLGKEFE